MSMTTPASSSDTDNMSYTPADLVLLNGTIVTVDETRSQVEATVLLYVPPLTFQLFCFQYTHPKRPIQMRLARRAMAYRMATAIVLAPFPYG